MAASRSTPSCTNHDFAELTKDSTRYDGLFTLHKKDDNLYAEIKPQQLNQSFLAPITIAKGLAKAGTPITSLTATFLLANYPESTTLKCFVQPALTSPTVWYGPFPQVVNVHSY